jgi:hypothetical protein
MSIKQEVIEWKEGENTTTPPGGDRSVWWDETRHELACSPEYPLELERTYPEMRRQKLHELWVKFSLMLADPRKAERLGRLVREDRVQSWFEARVREDVARELASPRNLDEKLANEVSDRIRKEAR